MIPGPQYLQSFAHAAETARSAAAGQAADPAEPEEAERPEGGGEPAAEPGGP